MPAPMLISPLPGAGHTLFTGSVKTGAVSMLQDAAASCLVAASCASKRMEDSMKPLRPCRRRDT